MEFDAISSIIILHMYLPFNLHHSTDGWDWDKAVCRNEIAFIVSRSSQFCNAIAIFNTTALGFWSQTGGFDCNAIEGQSSSPSPHWIVVNLCAIHKSSSLWLFLARSDFFGFNLSRDLRARGYLLLICNDIIVGLRNIISSVAMHYIHLGSLWGPPRMMNWSFWRRRRRLSREICCIL